MLSVVLSTMTIAAPPPGSPAQGSPAADPAQPQTPPSAAPPPPDDSLFEYLGSDDVDDVRWWDYLMKSAPRAQPPPQTSAQDANK